MRELREFASFRTHLTCPQCPRSPRCPPSLVVGILVQCVECRARNRRNAFGVWRGCGHATQPREMKINRATGFAADAGETRRSRRRRRRGTGRGSERIAGARQRALAFAGFSAPSRCRDGMVAGSCPDHSRSSGMREDGQFGHLDKVFDVVGLASCDLWCTSKLRRIGQSSGGPLTRGYDPI